MVKSGKIGNVFHMDANYYQSWLTSNYWGNWKEEDKWLWSYLLSMEAREL